LLNKVFDEWLNAWNYKDFKYRVSLTIPVFALVMYFMSNFLEYIENRKGVVLQDPILNLFAPMDVTWITFILIYSGLLIGVYFLFLEPRQMILAFQAYTLLYFFRVTGMFITPFDAPENIIPLNDPFVEFFSTAGTVLTKDLFFSGHTSTLFLLYLTATKKKLRIIFMIATILVAICVVIQHVHYIVDVFAAPFFAYGSYRLAYNAERQIKYYFYRSMK